MWCYSEFPLGCVGLAPTFHFILTFSEEGGTWQQKTSKSMDRKVNSLLSVSNQRLTGSQSHRKWKLKGNTRLYLVHSFASGQINYAYISPDRCLSNSISSPSYPSQCLCMSALLMTSSSYCPIWTSTVVLSDHCFHLSHRNGEEITLLLSFSLLPIWIKKHTGIRPPRDEK